MPRSSLKYASARDEALKGAASSVPNTASVGISLGWNVQMAVESLWFPSISVKFGILSLTMRRLFREGKR